MNPAGVDVPLAELCTEHLRAFDIAIDQLLAVPATVQQALMFGLLFGTLLGSLFVARGQVQALRDFLDDEKAKFSKAGAPTHSVTSLKRSIGTFLGRWWASNNVPVTLVFRVIIFGYGVPFTLFLLGAFWFTWLFPGFQLLTSDPASWRAGCAGKVGNLAIFMWSTFVGGATLGLSHTFEASPLVFAAPNWLAFTYLLAFRVYVIWSGTISLGQMAVQLALRQASELHEGVVIRIVKFVRRQTRPTSEGRATAVAS